VTAAWALFGYAVVAGCGAPAPLARLTGRGTSARLGLVAWFAAMISAGASGLAGAYLVVARAAAGWVPLTQAVCRSVAGNACSPPVYRSMLYEIGVTALAIAVVIAALAATWRYCHRVQRGQRQTRAHAYCVAGRPAAIVVTSSALTVLDQPQLAAVLAHERAHLDGRHHLLATVTRGLTAALPGVPLFTRGAAEVARLTEMAADDAAIRSAEPSALVTALLAMATGAPVAAAVSGLAAAACAVPDRVERLLNPPGPAAMAVSRLTLTVASALLILLPAALALISA
jgi:Zn-dependent protease with chaperone function